MIEQLFVSVLLSLATGVVKGGLFKTFHALVDAEIRQTDLSNLVREPFLTALDHIADAELEPNEAKRKVHVNNARLAFMKAANLDAPIYAGRAACYVGICHRLLDEPHLEVFWYQKSLEMFGDMEARLLRKVRPFDKMMHAVPFLANIPAELSPAKFKELEPIKKAEVVAAALAVPLAVGLPLTGLAYAAYRRWLLLTRQVLEIQGYKKAVTDLIDARKRNDEGEEAASGAHS